MTAATTESEVISFAEYQLRTRQTAIYPEVGRGSEIALSYVALGLGEAGEVQGKVKKILRDDHGIVSHEKAAAIADELGDLLWYIAQLATELGFDLHDIAARNLDKLQGRKERGTLSGSGDQR